jgi:hypothetical protein
MPHRFQKDPTEFFSVVGAPYIREQRDEIRHDHSAWRSWRIGQRAAIALVLGAVSAGVVLSAASGVAKLVEVAQHVNR